MSRNRVEKPANPSSSPIRIVILGSGFAAIEVLKKLQKVFNINDDVEITLVSRDNFILFTPMLPEVTSGMIETRNIVTPVRAFCKRAKFYQAKVKSIDLNGEKTFVVAGGGFNGVETVGAINDFIHDSIKDYYKNIQSEVRVILIDTTVALQAGGTVMINVNDMGQTDNIVWATD